MNRRTFITTLAVGSAGLSVSALSRTSGATFMVAHGAPEALTAILNTIARTA